MMHAQPAPPIATALVALAVLLMASARVPIAQRLPSSSTSAPPERAKKAAAVPAPEVLAGSGDNGDDGPATNATLVGIAGMAGDASGNLFVSDSGANRIRRIDARTGIITTIGGSGRIDRARGAEALAALQLQAPGPLAIDDAGTSLFVGEVVGRAVKRIAIATGAIEDLGAPASGWGRPAGVLWTPDALLVADSGLGQIFRRPHDGAWSALLPTESRLRKGIRTMARDPKGRIYIAEYFAHRVLRLDLDTGDIAIFAGTGEAGDGADHVPATESALRTPDGLAFDPAGRLLIADSGNRRIRAVDLATGLIVTLHRSDFADTMRRWTPGSVVTDGRGHVWTGDIDSDRVLRFTAGQANPEPVAGVETVGDGGPATRARLAHPSAVAVDRRGNVYIADTMHHRIRMVDARDGRIHTIAGTGRPGYNGDAIKATDAWLSYPAQIQIDAPRDRLYIADYYNNRVRLVDLATGVISTVAGTGKAGDEGDGGPATAATVDNPHVLFLDGPDSLIVTSGVSSSIRRIDLKSGLIESLSTDGMPAARVIHGVARWQGGLLLMTPRPLPGSIDLLKDGKRTVFIGKPDINFPYHAVAAPDGELYICETGANRILKWDGQTRTVVADGLGRPRGIGLDRAGNLLIAETFHNRILRVRLGRTGGAAAQDAGVAR